ncbi:MAG: hypothetical protein ACRDTR_20150 [Rubrobacter sp.]
MSGRSGEGRTASERAYRVLLRSYPEEFREIYGRQMEQVFRDLILEETRRGGWVRLIGLWIRVVLDLAASASIERMRASAEEEDTVRDYKLAGVGFVLLLAPLYFVCASLLKYGLGVGFLFDPVAFLLSEPERRYVFNLVSPVVFLGGLVLALVLNGYSLVRVGVDREGGAIGGTARLATKLANFAVVIASLLLLGTLVGYVFFENFAYQN